MEGEKQKKVSWGEIIFNPNVCTVIKENMKTSRNLPLDLKLDMVGLLVTNLPCANPNMPSIFNLIFWGMFHIFWKKHCLLLVLVTTLF